MKTTGAPSAASKAVRPGRIAPHEDRRAGERRRLPDEQGGEIGQEGEQAGDEQERRRIMPAVEGHLRVAVQRLLDLSVRAPVPGLRRMAVQRHPARRVDVGIIGAERVAPRVERAVRRGQRIDDARRRK